MDEQYGKAKEPGAATIMPNWRDRIAAAVDLSTLGDIIAELEQIGPSARKWLFAAIDRKRALNGKVFKGRSQETARPAIAFAANYGLPAPDERRLHAYRLSTAQYNELQQDLAKCGSLAALQVGHKPGLFVLWASEWFRRSYRGGMRRWEDVAQVIGLSANEQVEQSILRRVTRSGLQQWQRPVYSDNAMQYLATLAREGGFPACAVAEGSRGWARSVLEAIVGGLMGAPATGEAEALELARSQVGKLPGVFNDAEFVQLCADLALAIAQVRRDAELYAQAAGLPVAAWLALNRPDWREALPISTGDADADALIECLMQVEAVTGTIVGVERILLRDEYRQPWREGARVALDGEISGGAVAHLDSGLGRLRAFASGSMARYVQGEVALFDPPGLDEGAWAVRSSRQMRNILTVPFSCALQLDLRAGERPIARIELPGGKPRRGQLLVMALEQGTSDQPLALRILGSGSGSYRQAELFLQVPADWAVLPVEGGTAVSTGPGVASTKIWRIAVGARLTDPLNDCYRVLCGQVSEIPARIDFDGKTPRWAEVIGAVDLFVGPPHVSRNRSGGLSIRQIGRREWRPAPSTLPIGHYEIALRHEGIVLDRRRIAVLPEDAEVRMNYSAKGIEYEIIGFGDVIISPASDAPVSSTSSGARWVPRSQAAGVYRFDANIVWREGSALTVSMASPGEACIARWDGRMLPHRTCLTLPDLRDLVAVDGGEMTLLAHLREPRSIDRAEMTWSFSREMPMSAVAADIASLLLPASIDAEVVLDMNNGINTNWHVRHFPLELKEDGGGLVSSAAIAEQGVELCGRAIADPLHETCFGSYTLLSDANHRPMVLPEAIGGDWLVYLRRDDRVLTRPLYRRLQGALTGPVGMLGQAMAQPFAMQDKALQAFLELACGEGGEAASALDELVALIAGLRGLPPGTFNVLKKLPAFPQLLTRMAFRASEAERDTVTDLALSLPFAWFLIPHTHWTGAVNATGLAAMDLLKSLTDAPRFAKEMVDTTTRALIDRQPLLAPVFGRGEAVPLERATQNFLRRAIERIPASNGMRYRNRLGNGLPEYFLKFDATVLDALDAPCAAALAVKGEWTPTPEDIRHLKLAARTFPTWFSEAFAAWLKERA